MIEHHPLFPEQVNVGFAQVKARDRIRLRVWERGAGLTKACGTGACAALVAADRRGLTDRKATLELDGGELLIEWRESDDHVIMTGPAAVDFAGDRCRDDPRSETIVDVVTFGCRLNAYESRGHPRAGRRGRADRRGGVQHLRGDRRGRAPGAPGDPQGPPRAPRRAADRHRLRGPDRSRRLRRHGRGRPGAGQRREERAPAPTPPQPELGRVRVNDIMSVRETAGHLIDGLKDRARAYVEVQNGCDHRCTFCIIPYGRGNSRSAAGRRGGGAGRGGWPPQGYREVVLTGVDVTSWGADLPGQPTLGQLVARILKLVPELPRLRLSSIDAAEIDPDLMRCLATNSG